MTFKSAVGIDKWVEWTDFVSVSGAAITDNYCMKFVGFFLFCLVSMELEMSLSYPCIRLVCFLWFVNKVFLSIFNKKISSWPPIKPQFLLQYDVHYVVFQVYWILFIVQETKYIKIQMWSRFKVRLASCSLLKTAFRSIKCWTGRAGRSIRATYAGKSCSLVAAWPEEVFLSFH